MLESIKKSREDNIKVYEDNERIISQSPHLQERVLDCFQTTEFYHTKPRVYFKPTKGIPNVTVVNSSALMEAMKFEKSMILNFASAIHPGGGYVRGANAQEECLCRSSILYNVLEKFTDKFYIPNRQLDLRYTDTMLYTPNVEFFKDDYGNPIPCKNINVLTAAAPNNRTKWLSDDVLRSIFLKRIEMVFSIAIKNNQRNIILGAWGCGAFGCNSEVVAQCFKKIVDDTTEAMYFENIVFAVLDNHEEKLVNTFKDYLL